MPNLTPEKIKDIISSNHDLTEYKMDHIVSNAVLYKFENEKCVVTEIIPLADVPTKEWKHMFNDKSLEKKGSEGFLHFQVSHSRVFDEGDTPYMTMIDLNYKEKSMKFYSSDIDLSNLKELFHVGPEGFID